MCDEGDDPNFPGHTYGQVNGRGDGRSRVRGRGGGRGRELGRTSSLSTYSNQRDYVSSSTPTAFAFYWTCHNAVFRRVLEWTDSTGTSFNSEINKGVLYQTLQALYKHRGRTTLDVDWGTISSMQKTPCMIKEVCICL